MASLNCPKCRGHNIILLAKDKNTKAVSHTSVNLNPLRPFTLTKTTTKQKSTISAGKVALGLATGGASLLVTGIKNNKHNEYFCQDCGNRWVGK